MAALCVAACGDAPMLGGGEGSPVSVASTSSGDPADSSTGSSTHDDGPAQDGGADSGAGPAEPDLGTPVRPQDPGFVEVTTEAGLDFDPGQLYVAPFCLLDNIAGAGGDYCVPERFLGAVAVGDFDGDQWPDVFMTRIDGPALLMRNLGDGTFEDVAEAVGIVPPAVVGGAAWVDIEGDGDLDLMVTSLADLQHYLYVNNGFGHFGERAIPHGVALITGEVHVGTGIGVGDYDLDGYMDLFVGDWRPNSVLGDAPDHNRLLHNRGAEAPGFYEDVTAAMGIDLQQVSDEQGALPGAYGFAPAFVDLNGDRWPELALAADYGTSRLYANDGTGVLSDVTDAAGLVNDAHGMGSALGDYDGDGDLDWFISAIWQEEGAAAGNRMYRNDGNLSFTEVTDLHGVRDGGWGWGAAFFDAEHDGDLDLALTSGWPTMAYAADPVRLWRNEGPGAWPDVAIEQGIDFARGGRGLVTFDYDRDGDLDLLVHSNTEPPGLFRNDGATGSWLAVRAQGQAGNSRGIGVEVRVQVQANGPWQERHIGVGSHLFGQEDAVAHFGLGPGEAPLHRVEVMWPVTGEVDVFEDVHRDQVLLVAE